MTYSMKCTCGHVMKVDAPDRMQAVAKMKEMMTQQALDEHWIQYHATDTMPKPTLEQTHMVIEQTLVEGDLEVAPGAPGMPPTGQM